MIALKLILEGYIVEVGALNLGRRSGKPMQGVIIEQKSQDMEINGLTEAECRSLAECLREKVTVTIETFGSDA